MRPGVGTEAAVLAGTEAAVAAPGRLREQQEAKAALGEEAVLAAAQASVVLEADGEPGTVGQVAWLEA